MLARFRLAVSPTGSHSRDKLTVSENPLEGWKAIIDVSVAACGIARTDGLAVSENPGLGEPTVTETIVEFQRDPLVPVTLTR